MTAAAPAQRAVPQMTHTPDQAATPQAPTAASAADATQARHNLRDQIAENPLLSLFGGAVVALLTILGTLVVALLVFTLTSINGRIDSLEVSLNGRIDSLEVSLNDRIGGLEDKVDAGFAAQGAQIAEFDRKLTALIAHLNATEAVDAALEHRLLIPGASALDPVGEPPG